MFNELIDFIKQLYPDSPVIPLHEPRFAGNEKNYVTQTIESTFVSSVGEYVPKMEQQLAEVLQVKPEQVVCVVNGTNALHLALIAAGVQPGDAVITQALTFVATANAIRYQLAEPVFVDVARTTLSLCPQSLKNFITTSCEARRDGLYLTSGRKVGAVLPMHTFGHPAEMIALQEICREHKLPLIEDAAEALGSRYRQQALGTFGDYGTFSFNGNKIVTTGGGGAIVAATPEEGRRLKHLATTAKRPHPWEFYHDSTGYNYRMPNLNAALGCAQLEQLPHFVANKRSLAVDYSAFFAAQGQSDKFFVEPEQAQSNYWLNCFKTANTSERDRFLQLTNEQKIYCRPIWRLMSELPMYQDCQHDGLPVSRELVEQIICLPSSVTKGNP